MDDGRILLITITQSNRQEKEKNIFYDFVNDYYIIDHANRKAIHLGTEKVTSTYRSMVLPVQNTLIKNDGVSLLRLIKDRI